MVSSFNYFIASFINVRLSICLNHDRDLPTHLVPKLVHKSACHLLADCDIKIVLISHYRQKLYFSLAKSRLHSRKLVKLDQELAHNHQKDIRWSRSVKSFPFKLRNLIGICLEFDGNAFITQKDISIFDI